MIKRILFFIIFQFLFIKILFCYSNYIIGTYFFGDSSPLNFWNSNELHNTDFYFKKIKNDGFNTIILLLPWREFEKDPKCYDKLNFYFEKANLYNLKVILRLSYFWDLVKSENTLSHQLLKLIVNKNTFNKWLNYLKKVYIVSSKYKNFLFGFISWEDFWILTSKDVLIHYPEYEKYVQFFKNFLFKKYNININYFPNRKNYEFKYLLKFYDYLLVEILYENASKVFPRLSIEARVDYDPIYKNSKLVEWFIHKKTFQPKKYFISTIYYAPFIGQKNAGNEISCNKAINAFNYYLKIYKEFSHNKNLFIDQFNFISFVPNLKNNTKIKDDDLCCFLSNSIDTLLKYTIGYSIWGYKYYRLNIVYNSSFENGLKGWKYKNVKIISKNKQNWVKLTKYSLLSQTIEPFSYLNFRSYKNNFTLCFKAFSNNKNAILNFKIYDFQRFKSVLINTVPKEYCFTIPNSKAFPNITFIAIRGEIFLDEISFFNSSDKSALYTFDNHKLWYTNCVVNLNKKIFQKIKKRNTIIKNLYKDNWMGKSCKIITLLDKKYINLNLELYLPEYINKKMLIFIISKNVKLKTLYLKKGINNFKIRLKNYREFELRSNFTFQPNKILKNSKDKRKLSVLISKLKIY